MSELHRICLIEDDVAARESLRGVLEAEGHEVVTFADGAAGLAAARSGDFDCVLTDLRLPGTSGLQLVEALHHDLPNLPVVLMTAHGTTETAIEATRHGAFDYLLKPFPMEELLEVVTRAAEAGRRTRHKLALGAAPPGAAALVGRSRAMQTVYKEIGRIAAKPVTVTIVGETGTGKELVARALWQHSDRAGKPFIAVNCAAIPANLIESELFGHERGAFTGAEARRIGRFEQAQGGTLLLDEVGDLPSETQVKLLRVLQERILTRVGGRESVPVDVRILAATHHDLPADVAAGRFREDLWYRLNVVVLRVPPLRERREDIPELVAYFAARHAAELGGGSLDAAAVRHWAAQEWPGNVRQLENAVKHALLMAHGYVVTETIARRVLDRTGAGSGATGARESAALPVGELCRTALAAAADQSGSAGPAVLAAVERELLRQAAAATGGNISRMAQLIGWSRLTVREKLRLHGLRPGAEQ